MVKNITASTIVADKVKHAKSLKDKTFGMILSSNSGGLIFESRFGIHTFFMKKPIDILVLDSEKRIVKVHKGLPPNKVFLWNPKYALVMELPNGSLDKSKTKVGHKIKF